MRLERYVSSLLAAFLLAATRRRYSLPTPVPIYNPVHEVPGTSQQRTAAHVHARHAADMNGHGHHDDELEPPVRWYGGSLGARLVRIVSHRHGAVTFLVKG